MMRCRLRGSPTGFAFFLPCVEIILMTIPKAERICCFDKSSFDGASRCQHQEETFLVKELLF